MPNAKKRLLTEVEGLSDAELLKVKEDLKEYLRKFAHFDNWSAGSIPMDERLEDLAQLVVDKILGRAANE